MDIDRSRNAFSIEGTGLGWSLSIHPPHPIIEYKDRSISYEIDIQKISERIISDIPVQVTRVPDGLRVL